jgi:oxygen-dependent protoporphyrinogen oxidase
MWPLAVTPILSPLGKLRAALEYFIPPSANDADESMAHFVRRRLGREVFDRLVEPLVSAVYAADMEKLSVLATLPRFRDMEREHGSLIRAMRHQMRNRPRAGSESGARYSMFVTLRDGLSSLIDAMAARLPNDAVHLNTHAVRIERRDAGWRIWNEQNPSHDETYSAEDESRKVGHASSVNAQDVAVQRRHAASVIPSPHFALHSSSAHERPLAALDCDGLILAVPSPVAARLLDPIDATLATDLATITHSGTAILSLGYDVAQIGRSIDAMGAVVPAIENSPVLAISFSSIKYGHRAPDGKVLLRVFVGGARRPDLAEMHDDRLRSLVLDALTPLLDIRGEPCYCNIAHWPGTMPQYHVGHKELVARIEARSANIANLQLTGNAYHGVGIPDCIHGGELAAERVLYALPCGRLA